MLKLRAGLRQEIMVELLERIKAGLTHTGVQVNTHGGEKGKTQVGFNMQDSCMR
jgi:hypothetical protein